MKFEEVFGDEGRFRAEATNVQVMALAHYLRPSACDSEIRKHLATTPFKRSSVVDATETRTWLSNAWCTERLLRLQTGMEPDAQRFAVQWAFPQAYYAAYSQVLALFSVIGATERTHAAAIRKFGLLARGGKLPACLSAYTDGGRNEITLTGVRKKKYHSPVFLDLGDVESVENQVGQLLTSTREKALDDRKVDAKFRTRDGALKRSLNRSEWAQLSERLGPSTVLAYLYRKRVKANYKDIDSFLRSEIRGPEILQGLLAIVRAFAVLCEGHAYSLLKSSEQREIRRHPLFVEPFVQERARTFMA